MSFFTETRFLCDTSFDHHHHHCRYLPLSPSFSSPFHHHDCCSADLIKFHRHPLVSSSIITFTTKEYCCYPPWPLPTVVIQSDIFDVEGDGFMSYLNNGPCNLAVGCEEILSFSHRPYLCERIRGGDVSYSYKLETEERKGSDREHKWKAEIKGLDGECSRVAATYKFEASSGKDEHKKKKHPTSRVVEIDEPQGDPAVAYKKKRAAAVVVKGKKKELCPQDAAIIIQTAFRQHLVRRSRTLRGLRDLAVAKSKVMELRSLFSNFSYRRRLANDPEERQMFSEKMIVLLLTVEAIVGTGPMIRGSRRSMIAELESMLVALVAVDPQSTGKMATLRRRKFDVPAACGNAAELREMAQGVAEVVHFLDQDGHTYGSTP